MPDDGSGAHTPLAKAHAQSRHNRGLLASESSCGCFFCKSFYSTSEIVDWCDKGMTAICPRCAVDSVIPASLGDGTLLEMLHAEYFEKEAPPP
jgi:hypothetical protein